MEPLFTTGVTTFRGQKADVPADVDIPQVPVVTDISKLPFMAVVKEMRNRSIPKLCKRQE